MQKKTSDKSSLKFNIGQRWISEMELNLGLGIVRKIENRRVEMYYPASECVRLYAVASAPLRRVIFKPGDTIESRDGSTLSVKSIVEKDGIFIYHGIDIQIPENELKDSLSFSSPIERLMNHLVDNVDEFNLRYRVLEFQNDMKKSPVRGFIGGRIDLIAHQVYIAHEVSSRYIPRVLLSDEMGLGKTIEACLIVHRLLLTERIKRVVILVPESLVHQWFVELLRKFNLAFTIVDERYLANYRETSLSGNYTGNVFLENQLNICSIELLAADPSLQTPALESGWDMVVVDEAHHLIENSPEYLLAKNLGQRSKGLLLLTATPEQFGFKSHFARLHLLDPSRFFDFNLFLHEEEKYLEIAQIIDRILKKIPLTKPEIDSLNKHSVDYAPDAPESMMQDLLDRLGTGRAIFQNTRSVMKGFPERKIHLIPIEAGEEDLNLQTLEFKNDLNANNKGGADHIIYNLKNDKRIIWLISLLKENDAITESTAAIRKKILLICRTKEKAVAIAESLRNLINIEIALFHEDLTLLQRDKNAGYFASGDGARILICSEIGSEGRNFQFSHHLVLFDLPFNPELLEQRIGRLDRIGQKETIHIYIPYFIGSEYEILTRWYQEGLNSFSRNIPGVHTIFQEMKGALQSIIFNKDINKLNELVNKTRTYCNEIEEKFKHGKDHLLELNSFRPEIAQEVIHQIEEVDHSRDTEQLMLDIFESYGIEDDFITNKTYRLNLSLLTTEDFPLPVIRKDDLIVTFDRATAVMHEDMEFITQDHPLVDNVLEFLLASEKGNASIAVLKTSQKQKILLEAIYVLECIGPKGMQIDRFLPPIPLRTIVNHLIDDCTDMYSFEFLRQNLDKCNRASILENPQFKRELFPQMLKKCENIANSKSVKIREVSQGKVKDTMEMEINRLKKLQLINKDIQNDEIEKCSLEQELLIKTIRDSRLRLDSIRLILSEDLVV